MIKVISKARKSGRYLHVPTMYLQVLAGTNDETLTSDTYSHTPDHQHTNSISNNGPIQTRIIGASATSDKGADMHAHTKKESRGIHIISGLCTKASNIYRGVLLEHVCREPPNTTHGDTNRHAQGATVSHVPGERALHYCGASRFTNRGASSSLCYHYERLAEPRRTIYAEPNTTHTFMESRLHHMAEQHPALAKCKSTSPSEPFSITLGAQPRIADTQAYGRPLRQHPGASTIANGAPALTIHRRYLELNTAGERTFTHHAKPRIGPTPTLRSTL